MFSTTTGPTRLPVNDLVYTRDTEGWNLHKSSYEKLRLPPDWIEEQLAAAGLSVVEHLRQPSGMWSTVAQAAA